MNTIPFQTEFETAGLNWDYPGYWNREVHVENQDVTIMFEYFDDNDSTTPESLEQPCSLMFCECEDTTTEVMAQKPFDTVAEALAYIGSLPDAVVGSPRYEEK